MCKIVAAQIEPRFYEPDNRFGGPEPREFNRRRTVMNNYMNLQIKRAGNIDSMLLLGSTAFLNHHQYFRDGVHLDGVGLERYYQAALCTVRHAIDKVPSKIARAETDDQN